MRDDAVLGRVTLKTTKNFTVRIGKSEAEVARDIVLLKLTIQTHMKHRAASLRQLSFLYSQVGASVRMLC